MSIPRELTKLSKIKEFSMTKLPDGFSSHPGDAVATSVGSRLGKREISRTAPDCGD